MLKYFLLLIFVTPANLLFCQVEELPLSREELLEVLFLEKDTNINYIKGVFIDDAMNNLLTVEDREKWLVWTFRKNGSHIMANCIEDFYFEFFAIHGYRYADCTQQNICNEASKKFFSCYTKAEAIRKKTIEIYLKVFDETLNQRNEIINILREKQQFFDSNLDSLDRVNINLQRKQYKTYVVGRLNSTDEDVDEILDVYADYLGAPSRSEIMTYYIWMRHQKYSFDLSAIQKILQSLLSSNTKSGFDHTAVIKKYEKEILRFYNSFIPLLIDFQLGVNEIESDYSNNNKSFLHFKRNISSIEEIDSFLAFSFLIIDVDFYLPN